MYTGTAKSVFDLLVCFLPEVFFTCPHDIYLVNSWKFPLVCTGCGTTWAIRTIDFAAPGTLKTFFALIPRFCTWCDVLISRIWLAYWYEQTNFHLYWWTCLYSGRHGRSHLPKLSHFSLFQADQLVKWFYIVIYR